MTQSKRFKPRGWCICKRGVALNKEGNLYLHYPTKIKYTNRDGYCIGSNLPPTLILASRHIARRNANNG